jgi:hypothetical protein
VLVRWGIRDERQDAMPAIFRKFPFFDSFKIVEVQGRVFRVFPLEIIVWVSLSPTGLRCLDQLRTSP